MPFSCLSRRLHINDSFASLSFLPEFLHFRERRLIRARAAFRQSFLYRREALLELAVGATQGRFRVDADVARQVDHSETKIANLRRGSSLIPAHKLCLDLACFLTDFLEHRPRVVPVEAHLACFDLELEGAGEGREGDRNAGKRT